MPGQVRMRAHNVDLSEKKAPRQARARATVAALLDATARILERGGYAALTTNRIAEVAGVSVGSVYEYFPNKQAIVARLVARTMHEIVEEVAAGLAELLQTPDRRHAFRQWFTVMMDAVEKRRALLKVLRREVPFAANVPEAARFYESMLNIADLGRAQSESEGVLRLRDPEATIYLLTVMVGAAIERSVFDPPPELSRERLIETLVEMVLKLL